MSHRSLPLLLGGLLAAALPLSACTSDADPAPGRSTAAPALRLVSFDSCPQLLSELRRASGAAVGPYGFPGDARRAEAAADGGRRTADQDPAVGATPYSGTNTHEQGVDEPDIVKTDGRRIVTAAHGVLQVVDAATRRETGRLDLDVAAPAELNLLLAGDFALVLVPAVSIGRVAVAPKDGAVPALGAELVLVSLAGRPTVAGRYQLDRGDVVDARQTGDVARVVLRSTTDVTLPVLPDRTDPQQRVLKNRAAVENAPLDAWLPGYRVTTGGRTTAGRVGCDRVSRPPAYSGASLLTVLTFDLAAGTLGDGDPVSVVADGRTVYGSGSSLYIASDPSWTPEKTGSSNPGRTDIYRFDLNGRRPVYAAAGSVPGRLINQYALSEYDGHLRVATTTDTDSAPSFAERTAPPSSSAIRVLRTDGGSLVQTGVVDGLGRGEQIYAVRFAGPRGYVVTFRQTDPLYSVDLSDPAKPAVTGELKITGYSAHLQPAGDGRLLGIGQEATGAGTTVGTQVSLFDVADPRAPRRLATQQITDGQSDAEYDPHALLWWPATNLLVLPVTTFDPRGGSEARSAALLLRVTDAGLTRVGSVTQPGVSPTIRRSLMVGGTLWTLSDAGLQANDAASLKRIGWVPVA